MTDCVGLVHQNTTSKFKARVNVLRMGPEVTFALPIPPSKHTTDCNTFFKCTYKLITTSPFVLPGLHSGLWSHSNQGSIFKEHTDWSLKMSEMWFHSQTPPPQVKDIHNQTNLECGGGESCKQRYTGSKQSSWSHKKSHCKSNVIF